MPFISYAKLLFLIASFCYFSTDVAEKRDELLPAFFVVKYWCIAWFLRIYGFWVGVLMVWAS